MAYWLVKSEPGAWSWDDHVKAGVTEWDGVRNYQAANNMKAMTTTRRLSKKYCEKTITKASASWVTSTTCCINSARMIGQQSD